jgi:hypothetical protein
MKQELNNEIEDDRKDVTSNRREGFFLKMATFFDRLNYSLFRNYMRPFNNIYVSKLKNLELAIKILLIVAIFLMIMIMMLVNAVIEASSQKTVSITVPSEVTSGAYVVNKDSASESYFRIMARGFVTTASNYNYMDAEEKINSLLPSLLPFTYSSKFADIKKHVQFIVDEKVNQKFVIQDSEVKIKGSRAKVVFRGLLTRTVGSITTIDNKQYEIPIIIKIINYTPYIESFEFEYIGVNRQGDEKEIALERQKEIERAEKEKQKRKENRQREYREKLNKKQNKDEFE